MAAAKCVGDGGSGRSHAIDEEARHAGSDQPFVTLMSELLTQRAPSDRAARAHFRGVCSVSAVTAAESRSTERFDSVRDTCCAQICSTFIVIFTHTHAVGRPLSAAPSSAGATGLRAGGEYRVLRPRCGAERRVYSTPRPRGHSGSRPSPQNDPPTHAHRRALAPPPSPVRPCAATSAPMSASSAAGAQAEAGRETAATAPFVVRQRSHQSRPRRRRRRRRRHSRLST